MSFQRQYIVLALIALAVLIIAFVARGFVQETIAPVVLYVFWSTYIWFANLPQVLIWAAFMGILLVIAVYSLRSQRPEVNRDPDPEEIQYRGRIEEIAILLRHFKDSPYFQQRILRIVGQITLQTLGHGEKISIDEARQMMETGRLQHIDPDLRRYLEIGWRQYGNQTQLTKQERSPEWLLRLTQRFRRENNVEWYDETFEQLVAFLEAELEVTSDS